MASCRVALIPLEAIWNGEKGAKSVNGRAPVNLLSFRLSVGRYFHNSPKPALVTPSRAPPPRRRPRRSPDIQVVPSTQGHESSGLRRLCPICIAFEIHPRILKKLPLLVDGTPRANAFLDTAPDYLHSNAPTAGSGGFNTSRCARQETGDRHPEQTRFCQSSIPCPPE